MRNKPITKEILTALQEGNHKAFEDLFVTYFNRVKAFINGYIKSENEAEELTENLFVNLWLNHSSIDPEKSINSLIHTMARNTAINYLKHKQVQLAYAGNIQTEERIYSSEDDFIAKETALLIEMAVEKMPEQRKQIYLLSRKSGFSNEEIAEILNLSKTNVESHLSLALKDIRKAIKMIVILFP